MPWHARLLRILLAAVLVLLFNDINVTAARVSLAERHQARHSVDIPAAFHFRGRDSTDSNTRLSGATDAGSHAEMSTLDEVAAESGASQRSLSRTELLSAALRFAAKLSQASKATAGSASRAKQGSKHRIETVSRSAFRSIAKELARASAAAAARAESAQAARERANSMTDVERRMTKHKLLLKSLQEWQRQQNNTNSTASDLLRFAASALKAKAKGKTKEGGMWWVDDLPWWMPPPPEWGPMPPTMFTSYYHQVQTAPLSTPNYGHLFFGSNPQQIDFYPSKFRTPADMGMLRDGRIEQV